MKYRNGEEFLNKMYKDMYLEETVKNHTTNKDTPAGKIGKYIERLDRIHKEAKDNERKLHVLKEFYYDKYIIKELPENYINLQKRILRERGYGNIEINSTQKEEWLNQVREEQKHSLDTWIDYLISDDRVYPMWFKNYAFRGMITLNKYDKEKESFGKRTNTTTEPFVELNREALSLVYDILKREIGENNLTEEQEELLTKGESFKKLYTYYYINTLPKDIDKETEGIWKKYNQGENYQELWKSLQGKYTGWCTAGEETCKNQIKGGDFYVYYTKDEEGNYTNPRIAIRMEGTEEIGEVRGIGKDQNLEENMTSIAEEKLKEFPNHEQYNKKVRDMKMLTEIDHKQERKEELTKKELEFLYEIEEKIEGFGYVEDPRIKEIQDKRNKRKDLALIFNCQENEVALTEEDLKNNKCIVAYGFDLDEQDIDYIKDLKYFKGNIDLDVLTSAENLILPEKIGGSLDLRCLTSPENLILPKKIDGYLDLRSFTSAEGLVLPEKIGRYLDLNGLTSAKGLFFPKEIGGSLELMSLTSSEDLVLPEIYKNVYVYTSANMTYIPDEEYFNKENKSVKK